MSKMGDAWSRYQEGVERLRQRLLALDIARDEAGRAYAHRLLLEAQAAAYNLVVSIDPRRPCFQSNSVFSPGLYDWLLPNPDFLYRYTFLDGRGTYRITGKRGGSAFLDVQTIAGFFGDPDLKLLESHRLDPLTQSDGTLEIWLGGQRRQGAWIALAPDAITTVILREAFNDWNRETSAELHVETIDPPPAGTEDVADKLDAALRMMEFCVGTFGPGFCQNVVSQAGENCFLHVDTSRDEDASNPGVAYVPGAYRIAPGEALLISFTLSQARYWGIHLADRWSRTTDYAGHQSSLNGSSAHRDANGVVRVVIAQDDPGIPNWLDPVGIYEGMMLLRWYGAETNFVPEVERVPVARLYDFLPQDTPRITPAERAATIAARRAAVVARYER